MDRLRGLRGGTLLFYYMFTLCARYTACGGT